MWQTIIAVLISLHSIHSDRIATVAVSAAHPRCGTVQCANIELGNKVHALLADALVTAACPIRCNGVCTVRARCVALAGHALVRLELESDGSAPVASAETALTTVDGLQPAILSAVDRLIFKASAVAQAQIRRVQTASAPPPPVQTAQLP